MDGLRTLIFDVADLALAKRFYTDVLGVAPYFDQPFYVGFDVAGYELGLRPAENDYQPGIGGTTAYLGVHDVDATVARLVEHGARVREKPADVGEGIRVASVVDPFGNVLGLIRNLGFAPRLVEARAGDVSERVIRCETDVALPRSEVWTLVTTSEGVASWFAPEANVELRIGGIFEVRFLLDQPVGLRGSETCRILSFLPERMLSFTWNAPPHLPRTRWRHTWVVVELADAGAGTEVTLTHTGWPASGLRDDPDWRATFDYFAEAWPRVLANLRAHAAGGAA